MPGRDAWKVGGTMAGKVRNVLRHASQEEVSPVIVTSALRTNEFNTTSALIEAAQALEQGDLASAQTMVDEVARVTSGILTEDGWAAESGPQRVVQEMCEAFKVQLQRVVDEGGVVRGQGRAWHAFIPQSEGAETQIHISTFGEILARNIYGAAMSELKINGSTLDLYEAGDELPKLATGIVVTGGDIRQYETKKGFSDISGARVAIHGGADIVRFFVIKDEPICEGDPRKGGSSKVVENLSLDDAITECSEGGRAPGVVHPNGLLLLQDHARKTGARIEVIVGSLKDPSRRTVISSDENANIQSAIAA